MRPVDSGASVLATEAEESILMYSYFFFLIFIIYLAVLSQLQHVGSSIFMEICRTFSCHTWDLVPQPGNTGQTLALIIGNTES